MEFLSFRHASRGLVLAGIIISGLWAQAEEIPISQTIEKNSYCKVLLRGDQVDADILGELAELKGVIAQFPEINPGRNKRLMNIIAGLSYMPVARQALDGPQAGAGKLGHLYTLAPIKVSIDSKPTRSWYGLMIVMSDRMLKFVFDTEADDYRFYYTKLEEVGDGSYFSTVLDSHNKYIKGRIFKNKFRHMSDGILETKNYSMGFPEFWLPATISKDE